MIRWVDRPGNQRTRDRYDINTRDTDTLLEANQVYDNEVYDQDVSPTFRNELVASCFATPDSMIGQLILSNPVFLIMKDLC